MNDIDVASKASELKSLKIVDTYVPYKDVEALEGHEVNNYDTFETFLLEYLNVQKDKDIVLHRRKFIDGTEMELDSSIFTPYCYDCSYDGSEFCSALVDIVNGKFHYEHGIQGIREIDVHKLEDGRADFRVLVAHRIKSPDGKPVEIEYRYNMYSIPKGGQDLVHTSPEMVFTDDNLIKYTI